MSASRRLAQRNRPTLVSASGAGSSRHRQDRSSPAADASVLPPYEPPSCAMTAFAQTELARLFGEHHTTKYDKQIDACVDALTNAATDGYDRVALRQDRLERIRRRRDKTDAQDEEAMKDLLKQEKEISESLQNLERQVEELNGKTEAGLRQLLDWREEAGSQRGVFANVEEQIRKDATPQPDEEHEEDASTAEINCPSAFNILLEQETTYKEKYEAQTMQQRYAQNHAYMDYKRSVHEAMFPSEERRPTLPKASAWFHDGVPQISAGILRQDEEDESEEELVVMGEKTVSFKDPLAMKTITDPLSSTVCRHHFERSVVLSYINQQGKITEPDTVKKVNCPVQGCSARFGVADLRVDAVYKRKLERATREDLQQSQRLADDDTNVVDDDFEDEI